MLKNSKMSAMPQYMAILFASYVLAAAPAPLQAATIEFGVTDLGGDAFQYHYTLINDSDAPIEQFTIFFDPALYANLTDPAAPADFDPLVVQPDPILGDGFFDALSFSEGLAVGERLSGFSIAFTFLGVGAPGAQFFEIIDPVTFETLSSGFTRAAFVDATVPVPGAVIFMGTGLSAFGAMMGRWRKQRFQKG